MAISWLRRAIRSVSGLSPAVRRAHGGGGPEKRPIHRDPINMLAWFLGGYIGVDLAHRRRNPITGTREFHMGFAGAMDRAYNAQDGAFNERIRRASVGTGSHPTLQRVGARLFRAVPHVSSDVPKLEFFLLDFSDVAALLGRDEVMMKGPADLPVAVTVGEHSIVLNRAIIQRLGNSEAHVASIMAHELAHAVLKHSRQASHYKLFLESFLSPMRYAHVLLEGPGALAWGERNGAPPHLYEEEYLLFRRSWRNEYEADLLGMEILARAGYDPRVASESLDLITRGTVQHFSPSHPPTRSRIEKMQANLPKVIPLFEQARAERGS